MPSLPNAVCTSDAGFDVVSIAVLRSGPMYQRVLAPCHVARPVPVALAVTPNVHLICGPFGVSVMTGVGGASTVRTTAKGLSFGDVVSPQPAIAMASAMTASVEELLSTAQAPALVCS